MDHRRSENIHGRLTRRWLEGALVAIELAAIRDADIVEVSAFLHENLNPDVPPEAWARALTVPWKVEAPNHGFLLRDDGTIVGAYVAYYSTRPVGGEIRRICNLGAWCVLRSHRFQGIRLLKALLAQEGYDFTDLSPSGNVIGLNERLKFQSLDTATVLMPNVPWPSVPGAVRVTSDPAVIGPQLTGRARSIFADHRDAAAAIHLVVTAGDEQAYLILRRDRRRGLPLFATLLFTSNPELTALHAHVVGRHLLVRHAIPATLLELRLIGTRPPAVLLLSTSRPKMFKSPALQPADVDYLYSELTCLPW